MLSAACQSDVFSDPCPCLINMGSKFAFANI